MFLIEKSAKNSIIHPETELSVRASRVVLAAVFLAAAAASPAHGAAQEPEKDFELSLFPPVQLRGEDSAIRILRLGLYNKNISVKGLDVGVVNRNTGGVSKGLQYGVVGYVEGDFRGWQGNVWANVTRQEFNGFQGVSLYNALDRGEAVQIGLFNRARDVSGFQLGIANWAENMHGVQVGLINIISGKESFQFLPIVNWSF